MIKILFQTELFVIYDYDIMVHINETSWPYRDRWIEGEQNCGRLRANILHLLKSSNESVEKFLLTQFSTEKP